MYVCPHWPHSNVQTLTSPTVLKILDSQGYPWLTYDLAEVIKLIGVAFKQKILYVIPSAFVSFLLYYCHSFRIIVIPSILLSFLPYYCHFKYLSSWIAPVPSYTRRVRKLAGGASHIFEYIILRIGLITHNIMYKYRHATTNYDIKSARKSIRYYLRTIIVYELWLKYMI